LIVQFPNSKFVPEAQQLLRNIQEALADSEYKVGSFYFKRGDNPAAANRLTHLVDQYPLYSRADAALWELGDSYGKLGPRFRKQAGEAYARIVKDYPLSDYADAAKKKLTEMELPVPPADPAAVTRMKWEAENRQKASMLAKGTSFLKRGPDVSSAARSGTPAMTTIRPDVPVSVPQPVAAGSGVNDITLTPITDPTALDKNPDARANPPAPTDGSAPATPAATDAKPADTQTPAQTAADAKAQKKKKKEKKPKTPAAPPAASSTTSTSKP
jgi:outer membrane protein assembly factor BamD